MRLHSSGAGYRLYCWQQVRPIYWLLAEGVKNKMQDIERTRGLRREAEEMGHGENQQI